MATAKQIGILLEKSFEKWNYKKAIRLSDNELKTRDYLIEPFFNLLGFNKMDHYSHEFSLRNPKGRLEKVDMVVTLNGKDPIMLVECKKATSNLNKSHFKQLSKYFEHHKKSKVGILTNGVVYEFYTVKWNDKKTLSNAPFLVFNLKDFTRADLEEIANFHIQLFNVKEILRISEGTYFLNDFNMALTQTLFPGSDELLKIIYQNMGGKITTDNIKVRLRKLLNSVSLYESIEKIKILEGKESSTGIFTSGQELKAFQIIKTILVMNPRLKPHYNRFSYKDYKGQFKIVVDEMPSKEVCNITITNSSKSISIENNSYELKEISTIELAKFKKKLVNSALKHI